MAYITSATDTGATLAPPVEARQAGAARSEYAIRPITSRILRMSLSGFWTAPVMSDFVADLIVAVKGLGCTPKEHCVLCDVSDAAIQSRATYDAFFALLVDTRWPAHRVAFVSTNPVSRMQARRLLTARDGIALFDDEPTALRWLMADA